LFISVSADVGAAVSGLNSLNNALNGTQNAFNAARPAALLFEAAAAGIGAGLVTSIKVAATFEQQISAIKSVMSVDEVNQFGGAIEDLALRLGRETVFSSREAAAGIEELIKAGIPVEDVLNGGAAAAINLAAATGSAVPQAAAIAGQVLNTFRVAGTQAADAVDILAKTANASSSNVNFLSLGLAQSGGVAAGLGIQYGEAIQTLGLLSKSFVSGSDAGTSYKTFLLSLTPSTDKQTDAFKALGLITKDNQNQFFNANGTIKSTADIAGVLQKALGGLTDEQRSATEQTLFGTDAIRAAEAFYREGASGVTAFNEKVAAAKSVQEQATERLNNLLGALQNLGGSLETVQIIVGKLFTPALKSVADATRGVVDQFSTLSPEVQKNIVFFTGIVGAVLGIVGGAVLLVPLVSAMGASFAALGGILASAAPFVLVAAGVIGILAKAWQANAGNIQGAANRIGAILSNFGVVVDKAFKGDFGGAVDTFIAIIGAIVPGLGRIIQDARSALQGLNDTFGPILANFGAVFQKIFAGDIAGAFDTFRAIIGAVSPVLGTFLDAAVNLAGILGPILGNAFAAIATLVSNEIVPRLQELAGNIFPALQAASSAIGVFWDTQLSPALARLGQFLETEVTPKIQAFVNGVLPTLQSGAEAVRVFWETQLTPAFGLLGTFLTEEVAPKITAFADTVMPKLNVAAAAVKDFWDNQLLPTLRDPGATLDNLAASFETAIARLGAATQTGGNATGLTVLLAQFDAVRVQVASLEPLFVSLGNFAAALGNLNAALIGLEARTVGALFESLRAGAQAFHDAAGPATPVIDALSSSLDLLGPKLQGATDFFNNAADAINRFADALNKTPAPNAPATPGAPGQAGGLNFDPGAFTRPGAPIFGEGGLFHTSFGGQGGGNVIITGPISISGGVELEQFALTIASAISGSTRRVNPPPDNSGNPQLVPSFA